jgi:hypothetical protein
MLLDKFLPAYEFNEVHTVTVQASPDRIYAAIHELRAGELSPLVNLMLSLRNLPSRLLRRSRPSLADDQPFLQQLLSGGFIPLGETPDREVAFGLIGQFWKLTGGESPSIASPDQYLACDDPQYAKVATNLLISADTAPGRVRLSTETRIHVFDPRTRRKFDFYWRLISLGSGFIRVLWLKAVKRRAERTSS